MIVKNLHYEIGLKDTKLLKILQEKTENLFLIKLRKILDLENKKIYTMYELDNNEEIQNKIMELIPEIRKSLKQPKKKETMILFFSFSFKNFLSMLRDSILQILFIRLFFKYFL